VTSLALLLALVLASPPSPLIQALRNPHAFPVRAAHVSYGRSHHDYPATDIFCSRGSGFVAPVQGVVDFVSERDLWDPATDRPEHRGGIAVAIVGDDGWRYYGSHLQAIANGISVGTRVKEGQLLGLTGSSGNAKRTPPHLHFGISRPTAPLDWKVRRGEIRPYEYLKLWAATVHRRANPRLDN
jgi:murein DD-endopeptidase MepM/ murein hydrolase activator NlpD